MIKAPDVIQPAVNYLYNIDFADIKHMFSDVVIGDSLPASFLPILGGQLGDHWVADVSAPYSLFNSKLVYIGPNTSSLTTTCSWFKDVAIVELSSDCQALTGYLVFHFHRM